MEIDLAKHAVQLVPSAIWARPTLVCLSMPLNGESQTSNMTDQVGREGSTFDLTMRMTELLTRMITSLTIETLM